MSNKPLYALSIKQPWAWLICKGFKDIENRDFPVRRVRLPLRIYVHTGKTGEFDSETLQFIEFRLNEDQLISYHLALPLTLGAIIGEVTITDCVIESESPWFVGNYGFVLADPVLYEQPIPCRGRLGFFKPEVC